MKLIRWIVSLVFRKPKLTRQTPDEMWSMLISGEQINR